MVPQLFYFYNGNPHTREDGLYIETGPWLSYVVNTMAADYLVMPGARASTDMLLT